MNVLFVANGLHKHMTLLITAEFTVEKSHTNAPRVTKVSASPVSCRDTNIVYTVTEDLVTRDCNFRIELFKTSSHLKGHVYTDTATVLM